MILVKYETKHISLFYVATRNLRINYVIFPSLHASRSLWFACLVKAFFFLISQ